jgi:hypothetical protein
MAGLTLLEAAKLRGGDVYANAVIELYAQSSDILMALPFKNINGNAYHYNQEDTLPGIAFRGINASWTAGAGVVNPVTEQLTIAGGELDVDRFIVNTQGAGVRASQDAMKIKHLAHYWTQKFIKGDSTSTNTEFDGLQKRLVGSQLIAQGATSGGDVLTLAKLDELCDAVVDPTHLIMSRAVRRSLTVAARTTSVGGQIDYVQDDFGRQVARYNGLPILIADRLNDYLAALAFDEANPGGGGTVGTSIYCVSFKPGMVEGIQNGPPDVTDLGELQASPVYRTRVEWYSSICMEHSKAAARLWGIKTGAVTA